MMKSIGQYKSVFFALATLLFIPGAFAQGKNEKQEKIEQLKIAFITKELSLTTDEAQKFWPVYNEMSDKVKAENKSQRRLAKDLRDHRSTYTEDDYKKKSGAIMDSGIKEAQLKKDYHDKIGGIIGYRKATKLLSLEQRFKKELLNRLNNTQGKPKPGGGRPGGPNGNR